MVLEQIADPKSEMRTIAGHLKLETVAENIVKPLFMITMRMSSKDSS